MNRRGGNLNFFFKYWKFFLYPLITCFLFYFYIIKLNNGLLFADSLSVNPPWEVDYWKYIRQNYNGEMLKRLKEIYRTSDKYFVYDYLVCYDAAFAFRPWTEDAIKRVSMSLDPELIIEIVEAARKHCQYYSQTWQPPSDYLFYPRPQDWMEHGPNLFFHRQYMAWGIVHIICWLAIICWTGYDE